MLLYVLAIEHKYYELLEFYGMCHEYDICPHCKKSVGLSSKMTKDVIHSFGEFGGIKIPKHAELRQITRDITIWSSLHNCEDSGMSVKVEDLAKQYRVTPGTIYSISYKMQALVDKFATMKELFNKRTQ